MQAEQASEMLVLVAYVLAEQASEILVLVTYLRAEQKSETLVVAYLHLRAD